MKKQVLSFVAGCAVTVLFGTLIGSALAFSGWMTIDVSSINILVNGEVFQPTNVLGDEVPVFVYNGTTYAPLRALAETYGLTVGYDAEQNLATVTSPEYEASLLMPRELSKCDIRLLKMGEEYFTLSADGPERLSEGYYTVDGLLFTDDVTVHGDAVLDLETKNSKPLMTSHALAAVVKYALAENIVTAESKNPYFKYLADYTVSGYEYGTDIRLYSGCDETVWYSPKESYTPMWWEFNGKRLYNLNEKLAEVEDGFQVKNGIRYFNGKVCVNDVLNYFGIEKEIGIGEYEGYTYLELR